MVLGVIPSQKVTYRELSIMTVNGRLTEVNIPMPRSLAFRWDGPACHACADR